MSIFQDLWSIPRFSIDVAVFSEHDDGYPLRAVHSCGECQLDVCGPVGTGFEGDVG
jgi:hypothetical protein